MERLFVDTSVWFAYFNRSDPDHERAHRVLAAHDGRLVSSTYVFVSRPSRKRTAGLMRIGE